MNELRLLADVRFRQVALRHGVRDLPYGAKVQKHELIGVGAIA